MRDMSRTLFVATAALICLLPRTSAAQETSSAAAIGAPSAPIAESTPQDPPENPWGRRPRCASMFLKQDWKLTFKQRGCDYLHNRLFSDSALFSAAWSAGVSKVRKSESEEGDGFGTRFARRYAQHTFKATASYLGGLIAGEDPRVAPPYLAMQTTPLPRGFWKRTRHALASNLMSYRCTGDCLTPKDIKRRPAISRIAGALASGYGSEVWTWDRENSRQRALRGAATAYGSSFIDALFNEFKPEITRVGGRIFGGIFAPR
jgi:hypothetical protein